MLVGLDEALEAPEVKACALENTFKIIGKQWTILILREMFRGATQFSRLMKTVEGINSRMLSLRLKELQKNGIIERKIVAEQPVRIEYQLTERGRALKHLLLTAAQFSMNYFPENVFNDKKPRPPEHVTKLLWPKKSRTRD